MSKSSDQPVPTVESIMAILRETAENLRVLSADLKELRESQRQTDEQLKQTDEQLKQTDEYIKNLSKETTEKFKETSEKFKETTEKFKETTEKFKETSEKVKETSEKVKETSEKVKETSEKVKETSEQIKNLGTEVGSIGNQWGKIAEYLVGSDFKYILKEQFGIVTDFSARNFDGNYQGEDWEIDIAAANGDIAVVGEVKVTMTVEKVEAFVSKNLRNFHLYMPDHRHKKIYGLIAFVKIDDGYEDEVLSRAREYGLLVVKAMGDTFKVLNPAGTELHDYGVAGKTNN